MRDLDVNSISVNDVLHTLRELDRDGKYEGMFGQFLTFASELTGISEVALAEKLYEGRQNDNHMEIDDSYDLNDGGMIFSVKLAENRFVDVKACGNGGPVYVMENEDGSTVYTGEWKADGTCPGYEYDEKAVLNFVKEHIKEQEIEAIEKFFASVNLGDYDLGGCEFTREDYEAVHLRMETWGESLEKATHNYLLVVRDVLDKGLEESLDPMDMVVESWKDKGYAQGLGTRGQGLGNELLNSRGNSAINDLKVDLDLMDVVVNSWSDLQKKFPMGREDMSIEEEEQFVEDCYKLYQKEGFSPRYWSPFTDNQEWVGKSVEIVGRIEADGVHDLSCLPMWKAKLDGEEFEVFPEEVIPSEMRANGCRWFDQPSLEDKIGEAEELKGNHNIEDKERVPIER